MAAYVKNKDNFQQKFSSSKSVFSLFSLLTSKHQHFSDTQDYHNDAKK